MEEKLREALLFALLIGFVLMMNSNEEQDGREYLCLFETAIFDILQVHLLLEFCLSRVSAPC